MAGTIDAVVIAASIEDLLKDDSMTTELEDNEVVNLLSDLNQLQKKQLQGDSEKTNQERIETATSFAEVNIIMWCYFSLTEMIIQT